MKPHNMLAKILRGYRAVSGYNAKTMADALGISPSYLSAIENEKRVMTQELIDKAANLMEMSREEKVKFQNVALSVHPEIKINVSGMRPQYKEHVLELARRIDDLTDDDWSKFRGFLNETKKSN